MLVLACGLALEVKKGDGVRRNDAVGRITAYVCSLISSGPTETINRHSALTSYSIGRY